MDKNYLDYNGLSIIVKTMKDMIDDLNKRISELESIKQEGYELMFVKTSEDTDTE